MTHQCLQSGIFPCAIGPYTYRLLHASSCIHPPRHCTSTHLTLRIASLSFHMSLLYTLCNILHFCECLQNASSQKSSVILASFLPQSANFLFLPLNYLSRLPNLSPVILSLSLGLERKWHSSHKFVPVESVF